MLCVVLPQVNRETPLAAAALVGDVAVATALIKAGVNINAQDIVRAARFACLG